MGHYDVAERGRLDVGRIEVRRGIGRCGSSSSTRGRFADKTRRGREENREDTTRSDRCAGSDSELLVPSTASLTVHCIRSQFDGRSVLLRKTKISTSTLGVMV